MPGKLCVPAFTVFFLVLCLSSIYSQEPIDPFYKNLAAAGKEAFEAGEFETAANSFEIAYIGFLDNPPLLLECLVYLSSSYHELRNSEKKDHYIREIRRLKLEKHIGEAKLPEELLRRIGLLRSEGGETPPGKTGVPGGPGGVKIGDLVPFEDADVPPEVIFSVEPIYPAVALQSRTSGAVNLLALISETGEVIDVKIAPGSSELMGIAEAGQQAVREWKFKPARKNGIRVKVWKKVTINFQFKR